MNGRGRRLGVLEPQSRYEIVRNVPGEALIIRDVGHMNTRSVTNDAERVVREIFEAGLLPEGRRLFYYDSESSLDELVVRDGRFGGFRPGGGAAAEAGS